MNTKQAWIKFLKVTLLVAFASLGTTGLAFADYGDQAAIVAANLSPCDVAWVADISSIPSDVLDEMCYATENDLTAGGAVFVGADFVAYDRSWSTGFSDIPLDVLEKIRLAETFVSPSANYYTVDSRSFSQAYRDALELAEQQLNATYVNEASWDYARALEDHAIGEGQ